jgi:hypothetical protein
VNAGDFIVACIRKTAPELRAANIESAARQYKIPIEWAAHYLRQELNHPSKLGR